MSRMTWDDLTDEINTQIYLEYRAAGGQRSYDDWYTNPPLTCSPRHTSPANQAEIQHRPLVPGPASAHLPVIDLQLFGDLK